jgi:hypothetical protein
MGNPQKSRPITGAEKSKESSGVQNSAPSEHIGDQLVDHLEDTDSHKSATPRDAAGYVYEMTVELKGIAESARLSFLAHLLDLAIEESAAQKRGRL